MDPARLLYQQEVVPALVDRFGYKNSMQVPRLEKISLNIGVGEAIQTPKLLEDAVEELSLIAGQRAVITQAKKSVSNFKLRQGMSIGCRVTLRKDRMYDFFYKLANVVIQQIPDFRGISPYSFDGRGNYSLGLREQIIFPEIEYDKVSDVRGLNITIVTTAQTDEEAYELLNLLGMPLQERT